MQTDAQTVPASLFKPEHLSQPSAYDELAYNRLRLELHPNDKMFQGNHEHYLYVGATALNTINAHRGLIYASPPQSILDFGSGAGRVTRWLRAAFPTARLTASDLRLGDLRFCADTFGAESWMVETDIESLIPPNRFDLIWAGSVMTHLPEESTKQLLRKFCEWLGPGGTMTTSLHGRHWLKYYMNSDTRQRMHDPPEIPSNYEASGYGYADYPQQAGYGLSIVTPTWTASTAERIPDCRIVAFGEENWGNHDILTLQKTS
jgi:SAM-dependent methyltransferase